METDNSKTQEEDGHSEAREHLRIPEARTGQDHILPYNFQKERSLLTF